MVENNIKMVPFTIRECLSIYLHNHEIPLPLVYVEDRKEADNNISVFVFPQHFLLGEAISSACKL